MSHCGGGKNLSTADRPSWAFVCGQATGKEENTVVKYKGKYMRKETAARMKHYDKTVFKLMSLPWELREHILSFVCDKKTTRVFLKGVSGMLPTAVPLPVSARAGDRKLRMETILVTLKQTNLEIHSGPALNNDIELMLKCHNLREITLAFAAVELMNMYAGLGSAKDIEQLRRNYRLDTILPILNRGELKVVRFRRPQQGWAGYTALSAIAAWMRWEFAIRAKLDVDVDGVGTGKKTKVLEVVVN